MRLARQLSFLVLSGSILLGTNCLLKFRDAAVLAGTDYVNSLADQALATLLPPDTLFPTDGE